MAGRKLGFFNVIESGGRYVGGVMITDENGIPQEFKYTEPIKPTRIQAILYGGSLERYIRQEVIRAKLLKSVQNKPEFIFVDNTDPSLLGRCEGAPVLMMQRVRVQGVEEVGVSKRVRENELVLKDHETRDPVRLVCDPNDLSVLDAAEGTVLDIGLGLDILEPLERVNTALAAILKETSK